MSKIEQTCLLDMFNTVFCLWCCPMLCYKNPLPMPRHATTCHDMPRHGTEAQKTTEGLILTVRDEGSPAWQFAQFLRKPDSIQTRFMSVSWCFLCFIEKSLSAQYIIIIYWWCPMCYGYVRSSMFDVVKVCKDAGKLRMWHVMQVRPNTHRCTG